MGIDMGINVSGNSDVSKLEGVQDDFFLQFAYEKWK
jgi:hypothetical protein